jgi:hypothetical protein
MGAHLAALLQRQFLKLKTSAVQSLAVSGYSMHAAAVALLQWQDTKLHPRVAALQQLK